MSDKPDWADEIAKDWDPAPVIAAALRKAMADGMRKAVTLLGYGEADSSAYVKVLADKIEKGES